MITEEQMQTERVESRRQHSDRQRESERVQVALAIFDAFKSSTGTRAGIPNEGDAPLYRSAVRTLTRFLGDDAEGACQSPICQEHASMTLAAVRLADVLTRHHISKFIRVDVMVSPAALVAVFADGTSMPKEPGEWEGWPLLYRTEVAKQ